MNISRDRGVGVAIGTSDTTSFQIYYSAAVPKLYKLSICDVARSVASSQPPKIVKNHSILSLPKNNAVSGHMIIYIILMIFFNGDPAVYHLNYTSNGVVYPTIGYNYYLRCIKLNASWLRTLPAYCGRRLVLLRVVRHPWRVPG